jgi:hypothetical protein
LEQNLTLLYCAGNAVHLFMLAFLWKCTTVQSKKGRKREEIPGGLRQEKQGR